MTVRFAYGNQSPLSYGARPQSQPNPLLIEDILLFQWGSAVHAVSRSGNQWRVWNLSTHQNTMQLDGYAATNWALVELRGEPHVVAGTQCGKRVVWNAVSGDCHTSELGAKNTQMQNLIVRWVVDQPLSIESHSSGEVVLWHLGHRKLLHKWVGSGPMTCLEVLSVEQTPYLFGGTADGQINVWNIPSGRRATLPRLPSVPLALNLADEQLLVATGNGLVCYSPRAHGPKPSAPPPTIEPTQPQPLPPPPSYNTGSHGHDNSPRPVGSTRAPANRLDGIRELQNTVRNGDRQAAYQIDVRYSLNAIVAQFLNERIQVLENQIQKSSWPELSARYELSNLKRLRDNAFPPADITQQRRELRNYWHSIYDDKYAKGWDILAPYPLMVVVANNLLSDPSHPIHIEEDCRKIRERASRLIRLYQNTVKVYEWAAAEGSSIAAQELAFSQEQRLL